MPLTPLDRRYLDWLTSQVGNVKYTRNNRFNRYRSLMEDLHGHIFVAIVSHDENRIQDSRELKYEYLAEFEEERGDLDWMRSPCSMLELLIILSRQLSFELDDAPGVWFWHFVETLKLEQFDDQNYDEKAQETIGRILDTVVWRTYSPDGDGGLFPLRHPEQDQRDVELWYQLNAYLLEQF